MCTYPSVRVKGITQVDELHMWTFEPNPIALQGRKKRASLKIKVHVIKKKISLSVRLKCCVLWHGRVFAEG